MPKHEKKRFAVYDALHLSPGSRVRAGSRRRIRREGKEAAKEARYNERAAKAAHTVVDTYFNQVGLHAQTPLKIEASKKPRGISPEDWLARLSQQTNKLLFLGNYPLQVNEALTQEASTTQRLEFDNHWSNVLKDVPVIVIDRAPSQELVDSRVLGQ